eukprot:8599531-Ditylum_brightwellii.AAC.1
MGQCRKIIIRMDKNKYFTRPMTMTYHNLCSTSPPLSGFGALLSLGLKYAIQPKQHNNKRTLETTMAQFKYNMQLKYTFVGIPLEREYNKKIYIKSKWDPPYGPCKLENRMKQFEQQITTTQATIQRTAKQCTNLMQCQQQLFTQLQKNEKHAILSCDKNWDLPYLNKTHMSNGC